MRDDIAIVGMACAFPGAESLSHWWRGLVNGADAWRTGGRKDLVTAGPTSHEASYALLYDMVRQALEDARIAPDSDRVGRTRLIAVTDGPDGPVACGEWADRVAKDCRLGQTAVSVDGCQGRFPGVLAAVLRDLYAGHCEVVLLAAIEGGIGNLSGEDFPENALNRISSGEEGLGAWSRGAAAMVLKRRVDAATAGDSAYAIFKVVVTTRDAELGAAYKEASLLPEEIDLLEIPGSEFLTDAKCLSQLVRLYGHRAPLQALRPLSLGMGRSGTVFELASLIRAALSLSNKLIPPALPEMTAPLAWPESLPFYHTIEVRPWIRDVALSPRRTAVMFADERGEIDQIILEEVVDEGAGTGKVSPRPIKTELAWDSELIVFAADTPTQLAGQAGHLLAELNTVSLPPESLADIAYTQALGFDPSARCRLAIVCADLAELREHLTICHQRLLEPVPNLSGNSVYFSADAGKVPGKVCCIFPGHGFPGLVGPYSRHLLDLCLRFPEVRSVFDLGDRRGGHPEDPIPTHQLFFPPTAFPEGERRFLHQRLASPRIADDVSIRPPSQRDIASFGVSLANWANWALLQQLRIPVDMLFGQSHGDVTALCAAGALDFSEIANALLEFENEWNPAEQFEGAGRMAMVSASAETLEPILARYPRLNIAIYVTPNSQLIAGEAQQLEQFLAELKKLRIWTQLLPYPAIHTPDFGSLRPRVEKYMEKVSISSYRIPVYSGMTGQLFENDPVAIMKTLTANLVSPLLLWQTTRKLYEDGARIFIQVGGGANMYSQAKANIGSDDVVAVSFDVDYRSGMQQLNHLCAALLVQGITPDLEFLYRYRSVRKCIIEPSDDWRNLPKSQAVSPEFHSVGEITGEESPLPAQQIDTFSRELHLPFLGVVHHHVPGETITIERVLDTDEDTFLGDHAFAHAPGLKPIWTCKPVVPLTMSLEAMAEVAACLAPGHGLIGFEDISANRWIALDDTRTLRLLIPAQVAGYDAERGCISIAVGIYFGEHATPAISATVLFGTQYRVDLDLAFSELTNVHPYALDAEQIYRQRYMFHGPSFHCLAGTALIGDRGVQGDLVVLPKHTLFRSVPVPQLLTDPTLLDAVGQLFGLWALEHDMAVFPIKIAKIELYCPTPAEGTRVPVRIEITEIGVKSFTIDVEIQNGSGHVWMRIKGWRDWNVGWSRQTRDFYRFPTRYLLTQEMRWHSPQGLVTGHSVSGAGLQDLDFDLRARFYLQPGEMRHYQRESRVPQRQRQWLLGRIAAKDAVRYWLATQSPDTEMLHPAAFVIENDERGQPKVRDIPGGLKPPEVSIAHCGDRAIAIAHARTVSVDLEKVAERSPGFMETITTRQERDRFVSLSLPSDERDVWSTRLWCAKEAAGKLEGTGLDGAPQRFEAIDVDMDGTITIKHHGSGKEIPVNTHREGDFIIAYAVSG